MTNNQNKKGNFDKTVRISMIAAMDRKTLVIGGKNGGIPWHISEDFKYFKEKTTGHPVIMGWKTWLEFNGRPLPNRTNIVISEFPVSNGEITSEILIVRNIEEAIDLANEIELEKFSNFKKKELEKSSDVNTKNKKREQNKLFTQLANQKKPEIFIIGGAGTYANGIKYANRLYLTLIDLDEVRLNESEIINGVKFPDYIKEGFNKKLSSRISSDDNFKYEFAVFEKN